MHILVIEDEEQLCRSIAEGLRMDGYETDTIYLGDYYDDYHYYSYRDGVRYWRVY